MTLAERLRALVDAAPPTATVPVAWLGELLNECGDVEAPAPDLDGTGSVLVDLTVAEVAKAFGRSTSAIRGWLANGDFPNAYRLQGREWRVPRADVDALQRRQALQNRAAPSAPRHTRGDTDTGAWRAYLRKVP